jgi:TolB-like protein
LLCELFKGEEFMVRNPAGVRSFVWIFCCAWCLLFSTKASCASADTLEKIGIVPFACLGGVTAGDVAMLYESVKSKLSGNPALDVIDKKNIRAVFIETGRDSFDGCSSVDCLAETGKKLQAAIMVAGSVGKIGGLFNLNLTVVSVSAKKMLFAKEYQSRETVESFFTTVTGEVVDDIILSMHNKPIKAQGIVVSPGKKNDPENLGTDLIENAPSDKAHARVFQGPTFGGYGRIAIGNMAETQSRWGAGLFYLQPTTSNGYFRVKLSAPLSDNDTIRLKSTSNMPDILTSFEHEWAWEHFGVGAGVACMYMHPFSIQYSGQSYDPLTGGYPYTSIQAHYNAQYAFNWICDIRGGSPNKGFRGRIVWPIPFIAYNNNLPDNYFFEYSALGVFGSDFCKGAMGIQGMYKERKYSGGSDPNYYGSYNNESTYYTMVPCGKIAFRAGKQSVVCATVDMTGIFIPSISGSSQWAPNFQINYTYSLHPVTGLDVGDGTF